MAVASRTVSKTKAAYRKTSAASLGAAKAKAHFLSIVDQVTDSEMPVTITKRGKPVARIVPVEFPPKAKSIFGCMKGTAKAVGDIVGAEPDQWEAML